MPLNTPLYDALVNKYGHVKITNENRPGKLARLQRTDDKKNPAYIALKAEDCEEYHINCPICGDRRSRLYISHWVWREVWHKTLRVHTNGLMKCFNEDCDLTPVKDYLRATIDKPLDEDMQKHIQNSKRKTRSTTPVSLPEGAVPVNSMEAPLVCVQYLEDRGFDVTDLYNNWGVYCIDVLPEYPEDGPKILYPVFYNGDCKFWQARVCFTPTREQIRAGVRKYYNTPGAEKSRYLYNRDGAMGHNTVVMVEGVTDAHRVGKCAVAFFGKVPSLDQTRVITNTTLSMAAGVIMLDPDARDKAEDFIEQYTKKEDENGNKVKPLFAQGLYPVWLEDKDPAEHTYEEIWAKINAALPKEIVDANSKMEARGPDIAVLPVGD